MAKTQTKTSTKKNNKRKERSDSSSAESFGSSSSEESAEKQQPKQTTKPKEAPKPPPSAPKILDIPNFSLEEKTFDSSRYELWSIRLPTSMPIQDLDGCELAVPASASRIVPCGSVAADTSEDAKPVSFTAKDEQKYSFRWGHFVENDSFRVMLPKEEEGEDEEEMQDTDPSSKYLRPSSVSFQRHINVVYHTEEVSETKLAPGITNAPKPSLQEGMKMRIAYESVPQKSGLKRRWMPLGSKTSTQVVAENGVNGNQPMAVVKREATSNVEPKPKRKRTSSHLSDHQQDKSAGGIKTKRTRTDSAGSDKGKNGLRPAVSSPVKQEEEKEASTSSSKSSSDNNVKEEEEVQQDDEDKKARKKEKRAKKEEDDGDKKLSKEEKKARKAERKAEKKAKKEMKKLKKEKKKLKKEE